jgi:hypothetical protein
MGTKRKSPLKQMIDESLAKLQNSEFENDPTLDEDGRQLTGPERFAKGQKHKDEMVIDSQLADIQGKEGYFLKLKKEMRPNEWMLMKTIESDWRKWPDIETEVAKIVKEHTKIAPQKWGSGPYKIEYACKGGIRGKNYPELNYYINAEEEFLTNQTGPGVIVPAVDATTSVTAQLDMLARLMDVMKGVQPTPIDPATIQKQNADAFQQGLAIKANEGSQSTQMMTAMVTGLVGLMTAMATNRPIEAKVVNPTEGLTGMLETLKTFGVLGNQEKEKPQSIMDVIMQLKAIGVDLFKKDDPLEQIGKLKQLASIAGELMGMGGSGEKPGILEKIVDMVGPMVPGMIKDLKETTGNAVQAQVEAGKNIERAKISMTQTPTQENENQMNVGTQMSAMSAQIQAFFNGLYDAVNQNNRMFYPVIYTSLLQDAQGQALLTGIANETHTAKEVIEMLQTHGGDRYKDSEFVMKRLVGYTNGFIIWIREMMNPKSSGMNAYGRPHEAKHESIRETTSSVTSYDAQCPICQTVFAFENEQAFVEEKEKECGVEHNGVMCPGMIQPIVKAS